MLDLPGIVSGCQIFHTQVVQFVQECMPFNLSVADDTGVGCSTSFVFRNKVFDDDLLEFSGHIQSIVGNAQRHTFGFGIVDVIQGTTVAVMGGLTP